MDKKKLLMMVEIAIFAAIGIVLDQFSFKLWAQGGSISFAMLPIMLMAIRWGLTAGLATGLIVGVLQMMFGAYIVHWLQAILDYGLAFTVVGLAALIRKPLLQAISSKQKNMALYIVVGSFIGGTLRLICHVLAGVVFFKEYAGDDNVWWYSIIYNGSYMLPATILTAIVAVLLFTTSPKLLQTFK